MSKYSEYIKKSKANDKDFYFGEGNWKQLTNKYITYKSVIDDDTIIIRTNNIKKLKGKYVLIVDNNKGVYLKDWQVKSYSNYYEDLEGYLVKLNRAYFKPFTFNFEFDDYYFEKQDTFDELLAVAKYQDETRLKVKV